MDRRVGVYVDVSNIRLVAGAAVQYDALRRFACRGGAEPQRLNLYLAYDEFLADQSMEYKTKALRFHAALRDQGFRVTLKKVKRYRDDDGNEVTKANADLDMAVDALTESDRLDTVLLVTGDGDFVQVVRGLQTRGCRVEVLAFDHVSKELRDAADFYINGYLVPGVVAQRDVSRGSAEKSPKWGEMGSRVRGICHSLKADEGYGFMSYWPVMPTEQIITRDGMQSAFFRTSSIPESLSLSQIPSRYVIFEFDLIASSRGTNPEAQNIEVLSTR